MWLLQLWISTLSSERLLQRGYRHVWPTKVKLSAIGLRRRQARRDENSREVQEDELGVLQLHEWRSYLWCDLFNPECRVDQRRIGVGCKKGQILNAAGRIAHVDRSRRATRGRRAGRRLCR